jgi:hypothetical protein
MSSIPQQPSGEQPRRLTHSQIIEQQIHALARGGSDHSSCELSRNARGDTQIRVAVRTGESDEVQTPRQAVELARSLYDELSALYPQGLAAWSTSDLQAELAQRAERAA